MKTGVSNNKIYADKFQLIESISEKNNNNSPSIDLLSYSNISNNNVYVDIADLDETEASLMYSQNAQQWGRHDDRTLSNSSSRKQFDDQSFYLANSTGTSRSVHSSFEKNFHQHPHSQDHRRHYSSSDLNYLHQQHQQHPRPNSQNSYYSRASSQPIKDYSNNSVQSPLALHSTNNIQATKASLNKSNSVSSASHNNSNSRAMNSSNSKMASDQKHMPSNPSSSARNNKNVNSNHLKKKIISPEDVIQLFSVSNNNNNNNHQPHHPQHPHLTGFLGHHHSAGSRQRTSSGSAIINENHRGRKSPSSSSSPPTMTHQLYRGSSVGGVGTNDEMRDHHMSHSIPNINQLSTRTIHLKRSDSTKANNLSLPLKQTSQQSHHSSTSHHSKSSSKDQQQQQQSADPNNNGFGICIKGNKTTGRGVFISKVETGSVAHQNGLRVNDAILEINGQPFTSMNHEEAVKKCTQILKAEKFCSMTVRSPEMMMQQKYNSFDESQLHHYPREEELYIPLANEMHAAADSGSIHSAPPQKVGCIWIDRHGRSVSPPHEYNHRRDKMDRVRRIDLLIEHGQSLGLMIRGGIEYGLGIFVTGVDKDSVAERSGLMIGDQILEVNNRSFLEITHDEAVNLLKNHKRMTLLIRDIGKIPYSCSYNNYPQSSSSWHAGDTSSSRHSTSIKAVKKNCSISSIEEKARLLLSRNHFLNLIHNISEYGGRGMSVEVFVTIILELLDTPEKGSYFDGIRSITQKLQSWYFGRPLQSRQMLRNEPHNSTISQEAREHARMQSNEMRSNLQHDLDGNLLVTIPKTKPILGIAIEGGANTKHPLPRIINIHENGAAFDAGGLEVGQLILEVDNHKVEGMQHQNIAKLIAESYTKSDRHFISFLVTEAKKSNLEPKPTALIYLETVIVIIHFCLNLIFFLL